VPMPEKSELAQDVLATENSAVSDGKLPADSLSAEQRDQVAEALVLHFQYLKSNRSVPR
jgi:hypothetical protein